MIRSTKTTLDFANKAKLDKLHQFIDEYKTSIILASIITQTSECHDLVVICTRK